MARVQHAAGSYGGAGTVTVTLGAMPTTGNTLVAVVARRGVFSEDPLEFREGGATPRFFTAFGPEVVTPDSTISGGCIYWRISTGTEQTLVLDAPSQMHVTIYEFSGLGPTPAALATVLRFDDQAANNVFDMGSLGGPGDDCVALWMFNRDFEDTDYYTLGAGWTTDYSDSSDSGRPYVEMGHATGTLDAIATASVTLAWAGMAVALESSEVATCDGGQLEFRIYQADADGFTYLATLCNAFAKKISVDLDGPGAGEFSINRYDADATVAVLGDGVLQNRLVKAFLPEMSDVPIFAFWLEHGDFTLLTSDEEGAETLRFKGRGALAYLDRGIMTNHSFLRLSEGDPIDGEDPFDNLWRLYAAGTGSAPGQILWRIIRELQVDTRVIGSEPSHPVPQLDMTSFDYVTDSDGDPWATTDATDEFSAPVGERVMSVVGRLLGLDMLVIRMEPDLTLKAWNRSTFGRVLTGGAFGAGVVRWVRGENIAESLTRQLAGRMGATHELVQGDGVDIYGAADLDATTRPHWEVFSSAHGESFAALAAIGLADLVMRRQRSEALTFPVLVGDDEANGRYLPGAAGYGGHYWVGDYVTVATGTGEFDIDDATYRIAAISISEKVAAVHIEDLDVIVELGSAALGAQSESPSSYGGGIVQSAGGSSGGGGSGPHSHPQYLVATAANWKQHVRVASTTNVTIASPGSTIDGVTMAVGDRFLAAGQSTGSQNGIYTWQGAAVPATRTTDFDANLEILGSAVYVRTGTDNAAKVFTVTNATTITVGSTTITFAEVSGGTIPAGTYELAIEGGQDVIHAHGNMGATETFDPTLGNVHTGTLNANCVFTISAPVGSGAATLEFWITGSGTRTWTWPGSVTWDGGVTGSPPADTETVRVILETIDGGTNWIANMVGGGGSADLDAIIAASSGQDIADALAGAAAPDSGNVFATMADVGGGSSGFVGYDEFRRTAGNYTINSGTWTDLDTGSDLDFTGLAANDVVVLTFWGVFGTENAPANVDVATIVSGSANSYFGPGEPSTTTGSGIWGWTQAASTVLKPFAGAASKKLVSGDLNAGALKLRLRVRGGSITLFGGTLDQFFWSASVFRA